MANTFFSGLVPYLTIITLCSIAPAAAFGAGKVPDDSGLFGYNGRHGDIATLLMAIPISFGAASATTKLLNVKRAYFGNWLRDYSQIMDVTMLQKAPEEVLRAIVSILGFMEFGYATREFDITKERLGVYRHEEHIDNPKGYTDVAQKENSRLRGPVKTEELAIDPNTGMKNYIANESLGIDTSSAYIRRELQIAIEQGRHGGEESRFEALRHLGAALHTLEDFSAHSNYVELCLLLAGRQDAKLGLRDVFAYVGDAAITHTRDGPAPPIVTGTFGPLDIVESLLGEVDDKLATGKLSELAQRIPSGSAGEVTSSIQSLEQALAGLEKFHLLPESLSQSVQSLKSSETATSDRTWDWKEVNNNPSRIWDAIEPYFKIRDDIVKWLEESTAPLKALISPISELSAAIDKMLFTALGKIVGPIIGDVRTQLEAEKNFLIEEAKAAAKDPDCDIFSAGSIATNPTHSQVAKDHFDSILNVPAARVAAEVTTYATNAIVRCWSDHSIPVDKVIAEILTTLHHPFNRDPNNRIQQVMFESATGWWVDKNQEQRDRLAPLLTRTTVAAGRQKLLIEDPGNWHNARVFVKAAVEEKSVAETIIDNVVEAVKKELIDMPQQAVEELKELMRGIPTPAVPNPFDTGLGKLPVTVSGGAILGGVSPLAFQAVENMGNVLKDILPKFW